MKRFAAICLLLILTVSLCACGQNAADASKATETATADEPTAVVRVTAPAPKPVVVTELKTPYATLKVPESFKDKVKTETVSEKPYTLAFKAKDTVLFRLIFDGKGEVLLGTLLGEDKNTVIYADVPALDPKSADYEENSVLQDGLGSVTEYLKKDYSFALNEEVAYEDKSTFAIKTSVVTLQYPKKWEKKVKTEVSDKKVSFSADGTPLFDVCFEKTDGGILWGDYNKTPVYVLVHSLKDVKSSAEETEALHAMQEDCDVVLENLKKTKGFTAQLTPVA